MAVFPVTNTPPTSAPTPTTGGGRLIWVDALRGLAILLVVLHHSFLINPQVSEAVFILKNSIIALTMPLLFFISGCMIPASLRRGAWHYADSKIRHVVWPYLGWQAQFIVMVGSVSSLVEVPNWGPISHLWFLFFILVYYIVAPLGRYLTFWGLAGIGALLFAVIGHGPLISQLGFHAFFFFMGAATFQALRSFTPTRLHLGLAAVGLVGAMALAYQGSETYTWRLFILAAVAVPAVVVLFLPVSAGRVTSLLVWVGQSSLVFYVVHFPVQVYLSEFWGYVGRDGLGPWAVSLLITLALCTAAGALRTTMPVSLLFEFPRQWAPWKNKLTQSRRAS